MRTRELDDGLDPLAARAAEVHLCQPATRPSAQPFRQLPCEFRHVALEHRRSADVKLPLDGSDNLGVIMTDIMDTVAGKKVQQPSVVRGVKFSANAAHV